MVGFAFIGVASGWGARLHATEKGAYKIVEQALEEDLERQGFSLERSLIVLPPRLSNQVNSQDRDSCLKALPFVKKVAERVALEVSLCVKENLFPLVIGGDHSLAIGTWSGMTATLKTEENFGLIWIDAHMDAHTVKTSPSSGFHGMPLACLLGQKVEGLENIMSAKPKLKPEHVVLIGVRSYEAGEEALLKRLGVKIFYMDEIKRRGLSKVMQEALEIVTQGTAGFGVSFDLDAYDPEIAPGVGSPEPGGLLLDETLNALNLLRESPHLLGVEIVEYNPLRDVSLKTASLLKQTLLHLIPTPIQEKSHAYRERKALFGT